jgi:hypothetical protein
MKKKHHGKDALKEGSYEEEASYTEEDALKEGSYEEEASYTEEDALTKGYTLGDMVFHDT